MPNQSEVIDQLYAAALEPELWPQTLDALARAVGAVGTVVLPISAEGARETLVSPEMNEPNEAYQRGWWQHDTRVARMQQRRVAHGVLSEADLFSSDELARDPFRQEFLREFDMGAFAAQVVTPLPNLVVSISVQRALSRGPFEPHELRELERLGKHAARAVTVSLRLAEARASQRTLSGALEHLSCGAVLIDERRRIVLMNGPAENLVGDGIAIADRQLRACSLAHQGALDRLLGSAQLGAATMIGPTAMPRPNGKMPLLLQALPIGRVGSEAIDRLLFGAPSVLVLIVDPERESEHDPVAALRLIGLTLAEARIAALIGAGRSRKEAAEALGISEWTAREAVKRVFDKLGIARQSELVKLVDRLSALSSRVGTRR